MELFSETPKKQQKVPDNLQFSKQFASNSVKNIMAEFYLGNITQTIFFFRSYSLLSLGERAWARNKRELSVGYPFRFKYLTTAFTRLYKMMTDWQTDTKSVFSLLCRLVGAGIIILGPGRRKCKTNADRDSSLLFRFNSIPP